MVHRLWKILTHSPITFMHSCSLEFGESIIDVASIVTFEQLMIEGEAYPTPIFILLPCFPTVGCGISLLPMIRFGHSNNYHKNWALGLAGSIVIAPSFCVWSGDLWHAFSSFGGSLFGACSVLWLPCALCSSSSVDSSSLCFSQLYGTKRACHLQGAVLSAGARNRRPPKFDTGIANSTR
jgi:hypothetical protein